jgi:hypothetical protein
VTVEAVGYVTDSKDVTVVDGQTTTHDVALNGPIATIDTSPVNDTVTVGDTALYTRYLYNTGSAPLEYNAGLELAATAPVWLSVVSGGSGTVAPGDSAEIVFMVDFRDPSIIIEYLYELAMNIYNNAPGKTPSIYFSVMAGEGIGWVAGVVTDAGTIEPIEGAVITGTVVTAGSPTDTTDVNGYYEIAISEGPVIVTVEAAGYFADSREVTVIDYQTVRHDVALEKIPGCDYVVGDVNGSDNYNGLDITYGVAFFKGGNPPLCAECALCPDWHYCGDVNGSCNYNGLDITYGVAYLKGGPAPIRCADCPPIGPGIAVKGKDFKPAVQPAVK